MKTVRAILFRLVPLIFPLAVGAAANEEALQVEPRAALMSPHLENYLKQYPASDADGDGVLTGEEYTAYLPVPTLLRYGTNAVHRSVEIPLRDGHKVDAELYLPARGEGPWPVVLIRAEYSRWSEHDVPHNGAEEGIAYLIHDTREWDGGIHAYWTDPESSENEMIDGRDVVQWIASQPWCNGRVGTMGGSGHGYASDMMIWANIPHYIVNGTKNTAGNVKYYWAYHNGVRRGGSFNWMGVRGVPLGALPIPTLPRTAYDYEGWLDFIGDKGRNVVTWYFNNTGWFDPMSEGALDSFSALQHTGRAFVKVEPRCHGGIKGLPGGLGNFPPVRREPAAVARPPSVFELLKGVEPTNEPRSTLTYFMMGDVLDASAPGNHYMTTHEWPVPHVPVAFYLHPGGGLSRIAPEGDGGSFRYTYDPRHPAPTIGGHHDWGQESGPWDQRPLRKRNDVLYFETAPLEDPFAITGKLRMKLYFSSDAEDTAFVVKVVDIYPDGYEFLVRESAGMGRYHSGYANPSPLEQGRVYELDLDLWSTAIVFNRGHRIGLIITSSSDKSYQVHPNTFEPVAGYEQAPVARNTIYSTPEHASVLILPNVPVP